MRSATRCFPRRARGFTLLEVLVALLVLSIGLLGLAGLQTFSLRNNHSAFLRTQAVALGYDAIDRMRSNRMAALTTVSVSTFVTDWDDSESIPSCSSNCSVTQMAQSLVGEWKREVERLPGGQGRIDIDDDTQKATVQVRWSDDRGGAQTTFTVETIL